MNWKNVHLALKAFFGALLYYIVYVCAPALLMVFGMTIRKYGQSTEEFVRESGNFYTVLGFGLVVLFFYRRCKKKGTRLFDVIGLYPKQVTLKKGLGMYAFGFCVSVAVSALITLIPFPAWLIGDYTEQSLGIFSGKDIILGVVATGFLAPFMEEIMFRGFIFSKLLEGFTERTSILLVSLMFALLHVNPVWILYAFGMAILLAKVAIREDNIAYALLMHLGFNLFSVINYLLGMNSSIYEFLFESKVLVAMYGIIGASGAVILFRLYRRPENIETKL